MPNNMLVAVQASRQLPLNLRRDPCTPALSSHAVTFSAVCSSCRSFPQDIKFNVHAHPTLSEVLDELFKGAHVDGGHDANGAAAPAAKQPAVAAA